MSLGAVGCSCDEEDLPDGGDPVDAGDAGDRVDSGVEGTDGGDAGPPAGRCGNAEINAGEECDDGNRDPDDGCNAMCQLECGDGMLQTAEICDTAIPAGMPGACPADCDDMDACTTDVLTGADCNVSCVNAPITAAMDGDGCCPPGETSLTDDDCTTNCGNMILEMGELCEDGTATPCPTSCDDTNTCTTDVLTGDASTCDAACTFTTITMCSNTSDGCCPSGCDSTTDADCSASCGNMIFEPPAELCEDGTAMPCPTSCDDGMACTADTLTGSAAMCNVQCSNTPITTCAMASDGCCPGMCNANNDGDCMPVCGNSVMEMGETCDDGNTTSGDGCSSTCQMEMVGPTAFRLEDLDLRDPHVFLRPLFSCQDATDGTIFGQPGVNQQLQTAIQTDGSDTDSFLDLSIAVVFRPLSQTSATSMMSVTFPDCTGPYMTSTCNLPMGGTRVDATATNRTSGTCLGILPMTVRPYSPAVAPVTGSAAMPCFSSDEQMLMISLSGTNIPLDRAQIAATYTGTPATQLTNGMVRGFLRESVADMTIVDLGAPIGMRTVSSLLRGGTGNCATGDDRDMATIGGASVRGWWFYLYFDRASLTTYTEM